MAVRKQRSTLGESILSRLHSIAEAKLTGSLEGPNNLWVGVAEVSFSKGRDAWKCGRTTYPGFCVNTQPCKWTLRISD